MQVCAWFGWRLYRRFIVSKKSTLLKEPKRGSVQYAARQFDVSIPTIYGMIADGTLKAYKIGRLTRISDQAIADGRALLESRPFKPFDRKKRSEEIAAQNAVLMRPRITA
jgi:excisionase family DNA binding protein